MTQAGLVDATGQHLGSGGAFNVKTLQGYEQSEAGDVSNLRKIAAVLSKHLSRPVGVEDLMF